MLIFYDETGRVIAHNNTFTKTEEKNFIKEKDFVVIADKIPPKNDDMSNPTLFINLETNTLYWVEGHIKQDEPFNGEAALYELLNATEYNTCLLEMQMDT